MRLTTRLTWLCPRALLARLVAALRDERNVPDDSAFRFDSVEIRRAAERRRAQYLAELLSRKSDQSTAEAPDRPGGRTYSRLWPEGSRR